MAGVWLSILGSLWIVLVLVRQLISGYEGIHVKHPQAYVYMCRLKCHVVHLHCLACWYVSLVPRPFPAPVLIACSIKTEGKAWEKESRA